MHYIRQTLALVVLTTFIFSQATAQDDTQLAPEDSFASENAVLDTSILFAIGAREARQELRGAFGWPTFQEGLVDGVYFRFDPDGYARFAPTPRLDTDVFEVICRPRTLVCMGRKDALQVTLNNRGQIQLEMSNISENDQFILSDGISELPLPPSVMMPLEQRMELLLSAGGELLVRRNDSEVHRLSLDGFGPVTAYLRWVSAHQDYSVLPRGWPIPNSPMASEPAGLTQTTLWQSPMSSPASNTQMAMPQAGDDPQIGADVAEVRGELNVLREILLGNQSRQDAPTAATAHTEVAAPTGPNAHIEVLEARINELMQMTESLQAQLGSVQGTGATQPPLGSIPPGQVENAKDVAQHLEYLMSEVGLTPDVALMVVQQAQQSQDAQSDVISVEQDQIINDILLELRSQLPVTDTLPSQLQTQSPPQTDYQLLTDYFRGQSLGHR